MLRFISNPCRKLPCWFRYCAERNNAVSKVDLQSLRTLFGFRLAAALLLTVAAVATTAFPAGAQEVSNEVGQESDSGDFGANYGVNNSGDYAFQCTPAIQFGNTGDFINAPSIIQYNSRADDIEPGGIEVTFDPEINVECTNNIEQSSAASSNDGCLSWDGPYCWDGYGWYWSDGVNWHAWNPTNDGCLSWDGQYCWDGYYDYIWAGDSWTPCLYWDGTYCSDDYYYYWWDGVNWEWSPDGITWSTVSNITTGALDAAKGSLPLMMLGGLALVGTAGTALRRRNWRRG